MQTIKNERGLVLLAALLMLMTLVGIVIICTFPLAKEVEDSIRHNITLERTEEIRRAWFGRIVETKEFPTRIKPGSDAAACFLSEVGMPTDFTWFSGPWNPLKGLIENYPQNVLYTLLRGQDISYPSPLDLPAGRFAVPKWHWNKDKKFWAGYRGAGYLIPPPGETDEEGNPVFHDGWGNSMFFWYAACAHWYRIEATDFNKEYEHFCSDQGFTIEVTNKSDTPKTLDVGVVYPLFGQVILKYSSSGLQYIPINETVEFGIGGFAVYPATGPLSTMKVIICKKKEDGRYQVLQTETVTWNAFTRVVEIEYKGYGEEAGSGI